MIFFFSLKISLLSYLLYYAASFSLSVERRPYGKVVRKKSKPHFVFVIWPLLAIFIQSNGVSLCKTSYRSPLMTSQFRNFPRTCHTITQITFASLPPHSSSSREFPEVSLTPKIPLQFESPKTSLFRGLRPGLYFSSKSEQSRPLQMEPRNLSTGLNLDLEKK